MSSGYTSQEGSGGKCSFWTLAKVSIHTRITTLNNKPVAVDCSVYLGQNLCGAPMYAFKPLEKGPEISERFQRFMEICEDMSAAVTL